MNKVGERHASLGVVDEVSGREVGDKKGSTGAGVVVLEHLSHEVIAGGFPDDVDDAACVLGKVLTGK